MIQRAESDACRRTLEPMLPPLFTGPRVMARVLGKQRLPCVGSPGDGRAKNTPSDSRISAGSRAPWASPAAFRRWRCPHDDLYDAVAAPEGRVWQGRCRAGPRSGQEGRQSGRSANSERRIPARRQKPLAGPSEARTPMSQNASMSNLIRTFTEIAKSGVQLNLTDPGRRTWLRQFHNRPRLISSRRAISAMPPSARSVSATIHSFCSAPAPPALNPGDDLHPTIRPRS